MPSNKADLTKLLKDLDELEQRRLGPLYDTVARDLKNAVEKDGLEGLQRAYDAAIKTMTTEQGTLLNLTVKHAAQVAGMKNYEIAKRYLLPPAQQRLVPGMIQTPSLEDLRDVLPETVATNMLDMPDRWGFSLSDRIWRNAGKTKNELHAYLLDHLTNKKNFDTALDTLDRFQLTDPNLPKHMQRLERAARAALQGQPGARERFLLELKRAKRVVETRVGGKRGTRGFQRETIKMLKRAVDNGSDDAIGQAVDYFIKGRQRYRSKTLLRNATNQSYQQTNLQIYRRSPYVLAVKWVLSGVHKQVDECDLRARANLGLGPGVYYKQNVPYPSHTNCRCRLEPVRVEPHQVEGADPYEPTDREAYDAALKQLEGPLAKQANRAGRIKLKNPDVGNGLFGSVVKQANKLAVPPKSLKKPVAPAKHGPNTPPIAMRHEADVMAVNQGRLGGTTGAQKVLGADDVVRVAKRPSDPLQAYVEGITNRLYRELDIDAPESTFMLDKNGNLSGVANGFVDNTRELAEVGITKERADKILDGFVADVWLANRDAVGLVHDNILVTGNRLIRADNGGALVFRAQGQRKSADQLGQLLEWDGLNDRSLNRAYWEIFDKAGIDGGNGLGQRGIDQINDILDLAERTNGFADLLPEAPGIRGEDRQALIDLLQARAALLERDILPRLGGTRRGLIVDEIIEEVPDAIVTPSLVTAGEQELIAAGRNNGYALVRDTDEIEDQVIMAWHETGVDNLPYTRLSMKARGSAVDRLQESIGNVTQGPQGLPVMAENVNSKVLAAVKSSVYNAQNNSSIVSTGMKDKIKAALAEYDKLIDELIAADMDGVPGASKLVRETEDHFLPWIRVLEDANKIDVGQPFPWQPPPGLFEPYKMPTLDVPTPGSTPRSIEWVQKDGAFERTVIEKGHAKTTGETVKHGYSEFRSDSLSYYETEIDGVRVRYWSDTSDTAWAFRGKVEVRAQGTDRDATERAIKTLETLGVNMDRPSPFDAEELYLRQIAYHRADDDFTGFESLVSTLDDQQERIEFMRRYLSERIGEDITKLPGYDPNGTWSAFGHSWRNLERPDMTGNVWGAFFRNYTLMHENTNTGSMAELLDRILNSGGHLVSTVDKLRRGLDIGGMSPTMDLRTGGASYFFTRVKRRGTTKKPGFFWNAEKLRRLDSISYFGDKYGEVGGGGDATFVMRNRIKTVTDYIEASKLSSNETIFKNSLSIFDGLDFIRVEPWERNDILDVFRRHGIDQWPDGRALEDVIIERGATAPKKIPGAP